MPGRQPGVQLLLGCLQPLPRSPRLGVRLLGLEKPLDVQRLPLLDGATGKVSQDTSQPKSGGGGGSGGDGVAWWGWEGMERGKGEGRGGGGEGVREGGRGRWRAALTSISWCTLCSRDGGDDLSVSWPVVSYLNLPGNIDYFIVTI